MAEPIQPRKKVFISYSHKDEVWKDRLLDHLKVASREDGFDLWDDSRIQAGADWYKEVVRAIGDASVAVLLVSADFLNSDFIIGDEVRRLLESLDTNDIRIFPIIVRECLWNKVAWLNRFQVRPKDGKPLARWQGSRLEIEIVRIAREIAESLGESQQSSLLPDREAPELLCDLPATNDFEILEELDMPLPLRVGSPKYAEYLDRVGVFPLFGTSRTASVETSYVKIRISSDLERERYRSRPEIAAGLKRQKQGQPVSLPREESARTLLEAIESTRNDIALLGNAGSGKTTAFRHLAIMAAKGERIRGRFVLPLFLAVRDLTATGKNLNDAALEFLEWLELKEASQVLRGLKKHGRIIILLDGLDETDKARQADILAELLKMSQEHKDVLICISARPYSLEMGLPGFQKWETLPLALEERFLFVERWYSQVDIEKGKRLLAECEKNSELLDIGSNPLMLSIICALYFNDLKVPQDQDELYDRAVEGLLGAWDAFRNIARRTPLRDLSIHRRKVLLTWLAASLFDKGLLVFSVHDVNDNGCVGRVSEVLRTAPFDVDLLLPSLYNDFGILVERAPGLYSFSHLTLQEYLTARYIVDNRQEMTLLTSYLQREEWFEVIRLVAKMLPNAQEYMKHLTLHTDLGLSYETSLLRAAWGVRPICDRVVARELIAGLARKIATAARRLRPRFMLDRECLVVEFDKGEDRSTATMSPFERTKAQRRFNKRRELDSPWVKIMENLPDLLATIASLDFSYGELGCAAEPPFSVLWAHQKLVTKVSVEYK